MSKGISAWLITWDWGNDSAAVVDRIAAVLHPNKASRTVEGYVEFLYAVRTSTVSELIAYAKRPSNNPYRAKAESINGVTHGNRITCGANPWLYARKVKNLRVERDAETGIETIRWLEPPT